jgi:hypothetical protein
MQECVRHVRRRGTKLETCTPCLKKSTVSRTKMPDLDANEKVLLKMFANILESRYDVKNPCNTFTVEEFHRCPGRWELIDGMLYSD